MMGAAQRESLVEALPCGSLGNSFVGKELLLAVAVLPSGPASCRQLLPALACMDGFTTCIGGD